MERDHKWRKDHPCPRTSCYEKGTGGAWCEECGAHYWRGQDTRCVEQMHVWSKVHPNPDGYSAEGTGGAWCVRCRKHIYWVKDSPCICGFRVPERNIRPERPQINININGHFRFNI